MESYKRKQQGNVPGMDLSNMDANKNNDIDSMEYEIDKIISVRK